MAEYDGSIRIGTGIDKKGFKAGSKELEAGARSLAKSVSGSLGEGAKIALQKQTDAFAKLNQQYAAQEQKVRELAAKLRDMKLQKVETPVFKETSRELDSAEKKLDSFYGTLRRLEHAGKADTQPYKNVIIQIDIYKKKIAELKSQLKDLGKSGEAYVPADTSRVQQELSAAEQKQMQIYSALQTAADSLTQKTNERVAKEETVREKMAEEAAEEERLDRIRVNAIAANDQIIAKVERLRQLEQEIADLKAVGKTEGYADYDNRMQEASGLKQDISDYNDNLSEVPEKFGKMRSAAQKVFNILRSGFHGASQIGKKAFSGIVAMSKKAFSAITSGAKKSNGVLSNFTSRFKGLASSLLIFNQISKAFNAMISGMKKGFENLAGYSDSYAQSVQGMKNAMSTLGNQFAAAFAPIVQMAIPWINSLIGALSDAMSHVAQFIAVLTGKSTFTKAVQIQDKYNKSLGGTAKAADKARGALARFDDLDVLQKQENSGDSSEQTLPEDMFEEFPIENSFANMIQSLKDLIYGEDWEGIGGYVAEKLNEGLQAVYDFLNWDSVGAQVTYFVASFTDTLNGLIDGFDWNLFGKTIGAGINTAVSALSLLITGIDWISLGNGLASGVNGLAEEVDFTALGNLIGEKIMILPRILLGFVTDLQWGEIGTQIGNALNGVVGSVQLSEIGEMLGTGLTGVFQSAIEFTKTFDWKALGDNFSGGINSFFQNFDGKKFAEAATGLLSGLLDTIIQTIDTIDWAEIWRDIIDFIVNINWLELIVKLGTAARNLITGIFDGLVTAIIETDWGAVWDSILQAFKDFFGIHSPSTVMKKQGSFLMEGLYNGISALVEKVIGVFRTVKTKIIGVWDAIKIKTSEIWDKISTAIKSPINDIIGFIEFLANGAIDGINGVINMLEELATIKNPFNGKVIWSLDLPEIPSISIPRLATGAVIRGGNPFMAILGDQPAGQTNVEAPLDTIRQAVREELSRINPGTASRQAKVILNVNGTDLGEAILDDLFSVMGRRGYDVEVLGVR